MLDSAPTSPTWGSELPKEGLEVTLAFHATLDNQNAELWHGLRVSVQVQQQKTEINRRTMLF